VEFSSVHSVISLKDTVLVRICERAIVACNIPERVKDSHQNFRISGIPLEVPTSYILNRKQGF
jgi:hypothetical protein